MCVAPCLSACHPPWKTHGQAYCYVSRFRKTPVKTPWSWSKSILYLWGSRLLFLWLKDKQCFKSENYCKPVVEKNRGSLERACAVTIWYLQGPLVFFMYFLLTFGFCYLPVNCKSYCVFCLLLLFVRVRTLPCWQSLLIFLFLLDGTAKGDFVGKEVCARLN
jgi:hypothetical protein